MNYYHYFTEIEQTFVRRRGRNLLLSPLDWALIQTWQEREVPLHVVLRAIEKVFDGVDSQPVARKRNVKSLTYCREEIEAQYAEWLEQQVGKSSSEHHCKDDEQNGFLTAETISEHLANSIAALKRVGKPEIKEDLQRAIERLEKLKANLNGDSEATEKKLLEIENFLDQRLKQNVESAHLNRIKNDAENHLAAYKNKMDREVYENTLNLMIMKRLREEAEIPRLSLFSL